MADEQTLLDASIHDFFVRSGLTARDRLDCFSFVQQLYPGQPISPAACQGYCSMTVFVGHATVIQFRPYSYRLDLSVTQAARDVYSTCAPETNYITTLPASRLLVYRMTRVDGISFKDFRVSSEFIAQSVYYRSILCKDFAAFLARSWQNKTTEHLPLGKVGKTLISRLKSLNIDLPARLQPTARNVLKKFHQIETLPWILTHGDIVAGNIMVEPSTGRLTGLVDWAEAECLPFGTCLYGLEEILGEMTPNGFQYHPCSSDLRNDFWAELSSLIPDLKHKIVLEAVELARDLGILLWHGIAFDNGAIDRVVQEGRDIEEIHRLDAFLISCKSHEPGITSMI